MGVLQSRHSELLSLPDHNEFVGAKPNYRYARSGHIVSPKSFIGDK